MNKNKVVFDKFKKKYTFILENKDLSEVMNHHYNKNGSFIIFLLALLENRLGQKKIMNNVFINKDEWVELFISLYSEPKSKELVSKLEINPITQLQQTIESFECFNKFANDFIDFIKKHNLNINIDENKLKTLIKNVFGYILYNSINLKIPYDFKDILLDPDYETKYQYILNNTKLYAAAKQSIIDNCNNKINDLIVLLLGLSNQLNYTR